MSNDNWYKLVVNGRPCIVTAKSYDAARKHLMDLDLEAVYFDLISSRVGYNFVLWFNTHYDSRITYPFSGEEPTFKEAREIFHLLLADAELRHDVIVMLPQL